MFTVGGYKLTKHVIRGERALEAERMARGWKDMHRVWKREGIRVILMDAGTKLQPAVCSVDKEFELYHLTVILGLPATELSGDCDDMNLKMQISRL